MKMFVSSKHLTKWLSVAAASVLISCKGHQDPSKILAVEVGNPADKPRPKENKPIPMQLILVTLETNSLDEISKVEFMLDSVKLSLNGQSQSQLTADAENAKQGSTLLLQPQTQNSFVFSLPQSNNLRIEDLTLSLNFNAQSPGLVTVGAEEFAIDKSSVALNFKLDARKIHGSGAAALTMGKTISKSDIFEDSVASSENNNLPVRTEPGPTGPQDPSKSPINNTHVKTPDHVTPQPTVPETPANGKLLYRLKSSK
jgi:hypothetical protein